MKIQFDRQDSFYKITKTIEKIPDKRKVIFGIDSDNSMFANERWWHQFRELCESKELDYVVKATTSKVKHYCDRVWLTCEYNLRSPLSTIRSIIYSFFFKIRDFHYYSTHQKKYLKYIIFVIEWLLVLWLAAYVYSILIPKAIITITPSYDIEDISYNFRVVSESWYQNWYTGNVISIPYYQWTIPYHRILRTSIQSIRYSAQTARGTILLTNTSGKEYALKPYTRFITDNNLVFKTSKWVTVPIEGSVEMELLADDADDVGKLMWIRGNIASGTVMYIRNLAESRTRKLVIGRAIANFSGGDTLARWVVTQQDINAFDALARKTITESVSQIIREGIKDKSVISLAYKPLMSGIITNIAVDAKLWEPLLEFDGVVDADVIYHYIKQEDLDRAVSRYFAQRSTQSLRLVSIQPESLKMFEPIVVATGIYSIPMTISTFRSYNFQSDVWGVMSQITQRIAGMSKEQARQEILSYPDISVVNISVSPFWYQTIPSIKSRIEFKVAESNSLTQ